MANDFDSIDRGQPPLIENQALHADTRRTATSGLQTTGGYVQINYGDPRLRGINAMRTYLEMGDDPSCGVLLYLMLSITAQVNWDVREFSSDGEDVQNAQFLQTCMDDMGQTWGDFMGACMQGMTQFGFAPFEQVYKVRDGRVPKDEGAEPSKYSDGKIGWADFQCIGQDTITKWDFDDNNRVLGLWQQAAPTFQAVNIPAIRLVNIRKATFRDNPMGESIFRRAYEPWRRKRALENIEGIAIERDLCGVPVAHVPLEVLQDNATPDRQRLRASLSKIVTRMRTGDQAGVLFPNVLDGTGNPLYKLELMTSAGSRTIDVGKVIDRINSDIFRCALADFLGIGTTSSNAGSYAAHADKSQLFLMGLRSFLKVIAETLNRVAVPRLFAVNGIEAKGYPEIYHTPLDQVDIGQLATAIQALSGAGMPIFPNENIEARLLEILGLPAAVDSTTQANPLEVNTAVGTEQPQVIKPGDTTPPGQTPGQDGSQGKPPAFNRIG